MRHRISWRWQLHPKEWKLVVFSISSNTINCQILCTVFIQQFFKQGLFWFLQLLKQVCICFKGDVSWLEASFLSDVKAKLGGDSRKAWLPSKINSQVGMDLVQPRVAWTRWLRKGQVFCACSDLCLALEEKACWFGANKTFLMKGRSNTQPHHLPSLKKIDFRWPYLNKHFECKITRTLGERERNNPCYKKDS